MALATAAGSVCQIFGWTSRRPDFGTRQKAILHRPGRQWRALQIFSKSHVPNPESAIQEANEKD